MSLKFEVTGEVVDEWIEKEFRKENSSTVFVSKSVYFCIGKKAKIWTPYADFFEDIPDNTKTLIVPVHFNYEKFNQDLNHMDCITLNLISGELFYYRSSIKKKHWKIIRCQLKDWLFGGLGSMLEKKIYCHTAFVATSVADTCGQVATLTMRLLAKGKEAKLLCTKKELVAITTTLKKCKKKKPVAITKRLKTRKKK